MVAVCEGAQLLRHVVASAGIVSERGPAGTTFALQQQQQPGRPAAYTSS